MEDIYDRHLKANNGWKIPLGRGLDIFDRSEGRSNVAELNQPWRSCKACEIMRSDGNNSINITSSIFSGFFFW
jgi:hypothetical protein